jgi:hypothetical protein
MRYDSMTYYNLRDTRHRRLVTKAKLTECLTNNATEGLENGTVLGNCGRYDNKYNVVAVGPSCTAYTYGGYATGEHM